MDTASDAPMNSQWAVDSPGAFNESCAPGQRHVQAGIEPRLQASLERINEGPRMIASPHTLPVRVHE
jgi:hypothetical protein